MIPITKRCDKCGHHTITKVRVDPKRPAMLQWYYYCESCNLHEIFMEEPLNEDPEDDDF